MRQILMSKLALSLMKYDVIAIILIAFGWLQGSQVQAQTVGANSTLLPTLGDGGEMSSSAERRLGDRIARDMYRDPDYLDDPILVDYVLGIWQPLLAAARARGDLSPELQERFAWEIMLGRDRTVNAFALPGGYFGVHLGLLAVVGSADELASVLGHELSHVTQRHISRLIARQGQQAPWLLGALILGALAASKSPDAANALIVGGQAASAQGQLNFSRDMEREADRVGYGIMTEAGFDPRGFVGMFDKLQQASRLNDNGAYPYLRSHPLTTERIADMQSRQPMAGSVAPVPAPSLEHAMMAGRARVLSNPGVDGLRGLVREADSWPVSATPATAARQAGALYAGVLAAGRLRDDVAAGIHLDRLSALVSSDPVGTRLARWLRVELSLLAGDWRSAQTQLDTRSADDRDAVQMRRPELLLRGQLALQSGQAAVWLALTERLQLWVAEHPRDAQAWQLLASAYAAQSQSLRALRAEAEARVAQLDPGAALDRIKAAQDLFRQGASLNPNADHIEASIIDTRRRQLESALREQALER